MTTTTGNLAITNAQLVTLNDAQPRAEAVLVHAGRITLVGSNKDILAVAGESEVYDAGGRTVVPGFIDGHAHFEMTCCALTHGLSLPTPPHTSLSAVADALHERVSVTPPGQWILARGSFNLYARVEEQRLFTRQELDAIS